MYNMNTGLLGVPGAEGTGATPRTPEIVNSLMAMTDPFKLVRASAGSTPGPRLANSPPSDATSASGSPPSLQNMKTRLIKDSLKLIVQSKRKNIGETLPLVTVERARTRTISEEVSQDSQEFSGDGLTPEDEERRRRRRERNKVAATKCRLKKRERTTNLVQESEVLESQNYELKSQIQALENQKRGLVDLLKEHRPCTIKLSFEGATSPSTYPESYPRVNVDSPYGYPSPTSSTSSTHQSSYHHKVSCETYRSSTMDAMYHRQQESRYCRTSGASTSTSYMYDESVVSDPNVMLPYCPKAEHVYMRNDPVYGSMSVDSPHTYVGSQDSPTSSTYTRPSSISVTTSSSDYESNTELLDSPSVPPVNYHFEKDPSVYPSSFAAGSCIT